MWKWDVIDSAPSILYDSPQHDGRSNAGVSLHGIGRIGPLSSAPPFTHTIIIMYRITSKFYHSFWVLHFICHWVYKCQVNIYLQWTLKSIMPEKNVWGSVTAQDSLLVGRRRAKFFVVKQWQVNWPPASRHSEWQEFNKNVARITESSTNIEQTDGFWQSVPSLCLVVQ